VEKDIQKSTKHYTENKILNNTKRTENRGWNQVLREGM